MFAVGGVGTGNVQAHLRGCGLGQGALHPHWLGTRERRQLQMPAGPMGMPVDVVVA